MTLAATARGGANGPITGAQAVDRALSVLTCFARARPELGITDISKVLDLSPSTVHRIVKALAARGFLRQNPETERYRLGQSMMILGQIAQHDFGLDQALPVLEEVADRTGESVNLGVRDHPEVIVLLHVESRQALRFDQQPGTHVPAHASSMGKCLLAFNDDPLVAFTELQPLEAFTPSTITELEVWERESGRIRERGYTVDDEETVPGVRCVGAPILRPRGTAYAAIAIQAPKVRMVDERIEDIARLAREAADRIAKIMGPVLTNADS